MIWIFLNLIVFVAPGLHADVSGRMRVEQQTFFEHQRTDELRNESSVKLEMEEHQVLNPWLKLSVEPKIRLSSLTHQTNTPWDGDLRDTFIEAKINVIHLQAGSFIKTWEGTDGVNPMDIASVHSFRDPLSNEQLGSWGVNASGSFGENQSWELLYIPWQTHVRLPGDNSPWWPEMSGLPVGDSQQQLVVGAEPTYQILSSLALNNAWRDNFGGRLQHHSEAWDLSLGFFNGAAQIPLLQPIISGDLIQSSPILIVKMSNPIQIQPLEYRRTTLAAAASYSQQAWIFRVAWRHDQPLGDDPLLPSVSDLIVGGAERTINFDTQPVIFTLEVAYRNEPQGNVSVLGGADPFKTSLLMGLRVPFNDDLTLLTTGMWDMVRGSAFAHAGLQEKLNGQWSLEGAFELFNGPPDTLLGVWSDKNRVIASAVCHF